MQPRLKVDGMGPLAADSRTGHDVARLAGRLLAEKRAAGQWSAMSVPPPALPASKATVRSQVWSLLATLYPSMDQTVHGERRAQQRFPYPRLVHLVPVTPERLEVLGSSFPAAGKDLSERGLGFYHPAPLPFRHLVATLERAADDWVSFLLDVTWCRFNQQGWYESGGRFLRALPAWDARAHRHLDESPDAPTDPNPAE